MAGTIVAGTLSDGTYSGSVTDTVRGACKAWVNFNGTGTVAIRAAYNVSSITDNGTGDYTVNFTSAMPDANYSAVSNNGSSSSGSYSLVTSSTYNLSTSSVRFKTNYPPNGSPYDNECVTIAIFR